MRVALISSGKEILPVLKGGSIDTYAYYLAKNLSKLGLEVWLYGNRKSLLKDSIKLKFRPIFFPDTKFKQVNYFTFNLLVLLDLLKKKRDINIIHTNLSSTTLLLSLFFKNIVFTSHSAYWWRSEATHKRQIEAVKKAKAVIAISRFIEEKVKKYNKNVFYVPNGVDIELFRPIPFAKKKLHYTILSVSSITEQKGLIYLAKAMKHIVKENKEVKWIHVGPGNVLENEYYKRIINFLQSNKLLNNCEFVGRVPLEKLVWYYQNSTIFVLPSLWEGMPLVVLEAMSCGLPIVSTKISGVEDLVINDWNGILVKPKDFSALSSSISELICNENLIKKMGTRSRNRVVKEFSWQIVAKKVKKIYELF